MRDLKDMSDSHAQSGGCIPGTRGLPAFTLSGPDPSAIPVLIAVPHAGRTYPGAVLRAMRNPEVAALRLEDRYADRLAMAAAKATGARLLIAAAPRAVIDLNRAPDDIDWGMFAVSNEPKRGNHIPSKRARGGLGLIPRRVSGIGELWKRRHEQAELADRIAGIHEPYHECLERSLSDLRDRWGAAVLLDLHSMPPIAVRAGQVAPSFVLGDRFGSSCHGSLTAAAFASIGNNGHAAAHNRPYPGGYVLERHGDPAVGLNALQLEVDRDIYLDSRLTEPGEGFAGVVEVLVDLVRRLAAEACIIGRNRAGSGWSEAAE